MPDQYATLLNACRYWKATREQMDAWALLENAVPEPVQANFALQWRNGKHGPAIDLTKVPQFYDSRFWQDQALRYLQDKMPVSLRFDFTTKWRQTPVEKPMSPPKVLDWHDPSVPISRYFTVGEVTKGDSRRIPARGSQIERNILKVASYLDEVREIFGPLGVTSWYRPPAINAAVGGVSNSQHLTGGAVDIFPYDGRGLVLEAWLVKNWKHGGIGTGMTSGRNFCHVDIRGYYVVWPY